MPSSAISLANAEVGCAQKTNKRFGKENFGEFTIATLVNLNLAG